MLLKELIAVFLFVCILWSGAGLFPTGQPSSKPSDQPVARPTSHPSSLPSSQPQSKPSSRPTDQPSSKPSSQPLSRPTSHPSSLPSSQPQSKPSSRPTDQPSSKPSSRPTSAPSSRPTCQPSSSPTSMPSLIPSVKPTTTPSAQPTQPSSQPTAVPSIFPTNQPSSRPTAIPSSNPSNEPTSQPTIQPSQPTGRPTTQPSSLPSTQPTAQPSQPSSFPTSCPSTHPSCCPTNQPTSQPSFYPSSQPTAIPSSEPSLLPSALPTSQPSERPTFAPSAQPTLQPSEVPSGQPTSDPRSNPTSQPSDLPSGQPTSDPSSNPTSQPSDLPSGQPTSDPSSSPTSQPYGLPTSCPSSYPSIEPSNLPTCSPTSQPISNPTVNPTLQPTVIPSSKPTIRPSAQPISLPSMKPTTQPTALPTDIPSRVPSNVPSTFPSTQPTGRPSELPSYHPFGQPTSAPTFTPSLSPSDRPSSQPTTIPSSQPSQKPSIEPSCNPSCQPTDRPSDSPSNSPSGQPTSMPTCVPTSSPSDQPTWIPSSQPSETPSTQPSYSPSSQPSGKPSEMPSNTPSVPPTMVPTCAPTSFPSDQPSSQPTIIPSAQPSFLPSVQPSHIPSSQPSGEPSCAPTNAPFAQPTSIPTCAPTLRPSDQPSSQPTAIPSSQPSCGPSSRPTDRPSDSPSHVPSSQPTSVPTCSPSSSPSHLPSCPPTAIPSSQPSLTPSSKPSRSPSSEPTGEPSLNQRGTVFIALQSQQLLDGQTYAEFLDISITLRPQSSLQISFQIYGKGTLLVPIEKALVPSSVTFSSTTGLSSIAVGLNSLSNGNYSLKTTMLGKQSQFYHVQYVQNGQMINLTDGAVSFAVLSNATSIAAPQLFQAAVSSDGSKTIISFNSNTNQAGMSIGVPFICSSLLNFTCAASSNCQWNDAETIYATVPIESLCLSISGSVRVSNTAKIAAATACLGVATCPGVQYADVNTIVYVNPPTNPIIPLIVMVMPQTIAECTPLLIDLTASSGSGGRNWKSVTIQVVSTNQNASLLNQLQDYMNNNYSYNPPSLIPANFFLAGYQYSFQVTLCNFLGSCSEAQRTLTVVSRMVPTVLITGSAVVTMTRLQQLNIVSSVIVSACHGIPGGINGFNYLWRLREENIAGTVLNTIRSVSKDPTQFVLPAFSLKADQTYSVQVNVTSVASGLSSAASVQVVVIAGNIVAVVKGSIQQSVRVQEMLALDGSQSYDEDIENAYGKAAGLQYQWSCRQSAPSLNSSCLGIFAPSNNTETIWKLTALKEAANSVAQISLLIQDQSGSRSATAAISITVIPVTFPTINLAANAYKINSVQNLQLTGLLSIPGNVSSNATWSLISGSTPSSSLNLLEITTTPLFEVFPALSSFTSYVMYLVIPGNSLSAGSTYTFALTCNTTLAGTMQTGTVQISVNSPPSLGSFAVFPQSGIEIMEDFSFACSRWVDENLPLSYQFSYISLSGTKIVLRSISQVSYTSSILSKGSASQNYSVVTVADIYDSVMANISSLVSIAVLPNANSGGSVTRNVSSIIQNLLNSSKWVSTDDIMKGTAIATDVLNQADCSLAPDCTLLNRKPCYSTANTCGPCVSSSLIGITGDSNEKCVDITSIQSFSPPTTGTLQTCVGNCYGHGQCQYIDVITSNLLAACYTGDISCTVNCACDNGYSESANCELSDDNMATRRILREQIIFNVKSYITLQNPSEQGLEGWLSTLSEASQVHQELNNNSINTLLELSNYALTLAQSNDYSSNSLAEILSVLDSVSSAVSRINQNNSSSSSDSGVFIIKLLAGYTEQLLNEMLPGQYASTSVQNNFRVLSQSILSTKQANQNISISLPQSSTEVYLKTQQTSFSLPLLTSLSSLSVSAISLASAAFSNSSHFTSNVLSISLSNVPCTNDQSCSTLLTLPSDNSGSGWEIAPSTQSITCSSGESRSNTIQCPDSQSYEVTCTGESGTIQATCPGVQRQPTCNTVKGAFHSNIGCKVISSSEKNITCSCPILFDPSLLADNNGHRRKLPAASSSSTITVNYVSLLETVTQNFQLTVLSAGSLSTTSLNSSWEALITIGCLIGGIIIAMTLSYQADEKEKETINLDEQLFTKSLMMIKGKKKIENIGNFTNNQPEPSVVKKVTRNEGMISLAEEALPEVLRSQSLTSRIWNEVKRHHRWLGVIYYFSDKFPRVLRVISLSTNLIVMLFMQSLTYALTTGDDGTCTTFSTKSTCLAPRSAYGTGESKCYWTANAENASGNCQYVQPDDSITVIIFVAIFSMLVSTPIALFCDWIIHHILSAPILDNKFRVKHIKNIGVIAPRVGMIQSESRINDKEVKFKALVEEEFEKLQQEVINYYKTLSDIPDKEEFKIVWAMDEVEGVLMWQGTERDANRSFWGRLLYTIKDWIRSSTAEEQSVAVAIKNELLALHNQFEKERGRFHLIASERAKMKRLLYLFQKDLLPGIFGEILDSKDSRDNVKLSPVYRSSKLVAWFFLGALNTGMLFYVFLFAVSQDEHRQAAWGRSFAIWLLLEIVLVSTAMVIVLHIILPSFLMRDLVKIKKRLAESVAQYYVKIEQNTKNDNEEDWNLNKFHPPNLIGNLGFDHEKERFNSTRYLFLSYRVAELYPDLKASKFILQFSTPWPKQSYQHILDVSKKYDDTYTALSRSISIVLLFFFTNLLAVPLAIQDLLVHASMTASIGYTVLLHVQLYQIFPALVIGPSFFVGIIVHFYLVSKRKQAVIEKANLKQFLKIQPVRNNTVADISSATKNDAIEIHEIFTTQNAAIQNSDIGFSHHINRRESVQQGIQVANQMRLMLNNPAVLSVQNIVDEDHKEDKSSSYTSSSSEIDLRDFLKQIEQDNIERLTVETFSQVVEVNEATSNDRQISENLANDLKKIDLILEAPKSPNTLLACDEYDGNPVSFLDENMTLSTITKSAGTLDSSLLSEMFDDSSNDERLTE